MNTRPPVAKMSTAQQLHAIKVISPRHWLKLAIIFMLLGVAALVYSSAADPKDWWAHGLWCFTGLAFALPTLMRAFGQGFAVVLTDHRLMFLAAFSLYFLFGAALLAVGPSIQAETSLAYYPITAKEALRVDGVNGLGFGIALLVAALSSGRLLGQFADNVAIRAAKVSPQLIIAIFLVLGCAVTYYLLSFDLGFRKGIVPGIVRSSAQFALVAVYLASARRGRGERSLRAFGIMVALTLAVVGLLQFNKSAALIPLLALTAGLAVRFGARKVLPVGLAIVLAGYLLLGNVTSYGRNVVGFEGAATLSERWQYLVEGWQETRDLAEKDEYGTWSRLCYTVPSAAGLDLYDAGEGGDGFQLMFWALVPRFMFPEKPEITKTGREMHYKITGSTSSSTGQGIFASGYYAGGWWGVLLASILCGWIIAQTSAIARSIHNQHALLMLPISLLGLYIAFRIDGDFVADYLGTFVFILYPLLAAAMFLSIGRSKRRGGSGPTPGVAP